ncbi:MAG TPA: RNA degradosome polyphosphate kinase [Candidatus Limnocylindria bacterium]|nr:RNA degradosome polyphosphate kinase [Candidatus Limnocylindria bacterium]
MATVTRPRSPAVGARPAAATRSEPGAPDRYLNRELSTLQFQERVLAQAEDPESPLLERTKFAAIVAGNIDEFYQVRVAGLKRQVAAGTLTTSPDGLTAAQQLARIDRRVRKLAARHAALFSNEIRPALADAGVPIVHWPELDEAAQTTLREIFQDQIFPVLTPLAVDPAHPFPYISNLSLNLAVLVRDQASRRRLFARIKVPSLLPRFMYAEGNGHGPAWVPLEDVIAANLDSLFPGMVIAESWSFRVTRHSDLEIDDDEAEDLLETIEEELRRLRFSRAVRLEVEEGMPDHVIALLTREMQMGSADVHELPAPLGLADLWSLVNLDRPDLKPPPFHPIIPRELAPTAEGPADVFAALRAGDILVHHPYDSFAGSVQAFIAQAAADPSVLAIKQTLYRTSGESPIVDALIRAAGAGKQVVVLVELKARLDEEANIAWARKLEQAGCHVVYGLIGLKTHCKVCMVVRQEGTLVRRYVHIGTGNYHPATARLYEDLGLLTADEQLTEDVTHLFNVLTGYSRRSNYDALIVAPLNLRRRMMEMIEREGERSTAKRPGRISMKMNALVDVGIVDALYGASQQGVEIDLLVRGPCILRPGIAGLSETIRVRSIVGRFLEHSRIYRFGNGDGSEFWIGSADMMDRNLDRRFEALVRVDDPALQDRLDGILDLAWADTMQAWSLRPSGKWARVPRGREPISLQEELMRQTLQA